LFRKTPLEPWIYGKIKGSAVKTGGLTRKLIESYQLQKLKDTIALAVKRSSFYRRLLGSLAPEKICSLKDVCKLPFTTPGDIAANPLKFLCVSQDRINRVVTLNSSGATGLPKRVFFTAGDQELTRDFFQHGMSTLVQPGAKVLILLPGELPGSVGDLLAEGLRRMDARAIPHGIVRDVRATLEIMVREQVDSLVGIPTQVLALARCEPPDKKTCQVYLKNLLLSTDHVPRAIVDSIEKAWNCRVYGHYGMTEMGLGGGVECDALAGYHLREADLYFEIVNPDTGEVVPEGEEGEVVFTTLTREGMPLIRYRTGDIARFIPGPCPCGTVLRRMARVKDRVKGRISLPGGGFLSMSMLDEALFTVDGVLNYQAVISSINGAGRLNIKVQLTNWAGKETLDQMQKAILAIPVVAENVYKGFLTLAPVQVDSSGEPWKPAKRVIQDHRSM
jgi:phenylacetate-coenzyme A ligase PaaK-like adenylate-forming protein